MGRFFWILIVLIFSVWIGLRIAEDPGYALFAYKYWTVEMPLWFAVVSFIVVLLLFYIVLRFFDGIDFSVYRWKNWLRWRRKHKSYSKTNRGLIELIEGKPRSAEQYFLDGVPQSDAPLINYLGAAKAAHDEEAYERRDAYLRKAYQVAPQSEVAIGLTQAQLQLDQGQLEQVSATLGHLRAIAPKHALILKLLERVYIRLADWQSLLKLAPYLRKAKIINDEQMLKLEEHIYEELLLNAANKHEGMKGIHALWETIPKKLQKKPGLIAVYTKLLLLYPEMANDLEGLLNKAVKRSWDKTLVRLYGLLETSDPKKQLAHAEGWQKQYGSQAVLFLTLARLCMRCQLWGKATEYFESSLKVDANAEVYMAYGKLLEQLGEKDLALRYYRDGLTFAAGEV
jgi:HemY protein